ncbi:protease complex subunit PrcB family protein [Parathalassolituus penaei]|uniref:Protease complex subunit PrcB family protein n=1 Tax=Parathalassolituus penaei TaxID=2997323 RepID=A0A9X3IQ03_9GAMM|nr:protease complex subunit PrcB family protein [Parathalassolituus penaei]MCY0963637.1 protease complex subunit PrcB family protein [Parathalassolituus penaei]
MTTFKGITLLWVVLMITACSTAQPAETAALATVQELNCPYPAGVDLDNHRQSVRISLGRRPSAGYHIELTRQDVDSGNLFLEFSEQRPDGMAAQMLTSPCMTVSLPDDWQQLVVQNRQNGQRWQFSR